VLAGSNDAAGAAIRRSGNGDADDPGVRTPGLVDVHQHPGAARQGHTVCFTESIAITLGFHADYPCRQTVPHLMTTRRVAPFPIHDSTVGHFAEVVVNTYMCVCPLAAV
jgi:hypothetical protein